MSLSIPCPCGKKCPASTEFQIQTCFESYRGSRIPLKYLNDMDIKEMLMTWGFSSWRNVIYTEYECAGCASKVLFWEFDKHGSRCRERLEIRKNC